VRRETFHRTVRADNQPNDSIRIAVVQANISRARGGETFGSIPLEQTSVTGLRHGDGTLSMARSGPDTAMASFFICVGDQPELDFGGNRNELVVDPDTVFRSVGNPEGWAAAVVNLP